MVFVVKEMQFLVISLFYLEGKQFFTSQNMRVQSGEENSLFASWLLQLSSMKDRVGDAAMEPANKRQRLVVVSEDSAFPGVSGCIF